MAKAYKILGQAAPGATTDTDVYTVPANTEAVISSIVIANRTTTDATYRIAARPDGATLANDHYVAYDITVGASDSTILNLGLTMDAADVLTVQGSSADLTFSVFGSEIS